MASSSPRNLRKKIRRPKTDEEFFEGKTPKKHARNAPLAENVVSSSSSSSGDEEDYSSTPSNQKVQSYKGPVVQYDPNLPPAPFISSGSKTANDAPRNQHHASDKEDSPESPSRRGRAPTQRDKARRMSSPSKQQDRNVVQRPRNTMMGNENGPIPAWLLPIGIRDQEKAEVSKWDGAVNSHWMEMMDMMTSEDDEDRDEINDVPRWSDIADTQKLGMLDTLGETIRRDHDEEDEDHYIERLMRRLRLTETEREDAKVLILSRQERNAGELSALRSMQQAMKERLIANPASKKIDALEHDGLVGQHLGHLIRTEDFNVSTRADMEAARRYWKACGLDPRSFDGDWEVQDTAPYSSKDDRQYNSRRSRNADVPKSYGPQSTTTREPYQQVTKMSPQVPQSIYTQRQAYPASNVPASAIPNGIRGSGNIHEYLISGSNAPVPTQSRPAPFVKGKTLSGYIQSHYQPDPNTFMGNPSLHSYQLPLSNPFKKVSHVEQLNASFREAQVLVQMQPPHRARNDHHQSPQVQHAIPPGDGYVPSSGRPIPLVHSTLIQLPTTQPTPSPTPPDLEKAQGDITQKQSVGAGGNSDKSIVIKDQQLHTPQKLRSACGACRQARRKCSGGPPCNNYRKSGSPCFYAMASQVGRPEVTQSTSTLAHVGSQGSGHYATNPPSHRDTTTTITTSQGHSSSYPRGLASAPSMEALPKKRAHQPAQLTEDIQPPLKRSVLESSEHGISARISPSQLGEAAKAGKGLDGRKGQGSVMENSIKRPRARPNMNSSQASSSPAVQVVVKGH